MPAHPSRIGRYEVEGLLGRGAMGVVFKAHDPEIDRTVAIKLVRADLLEGEDRAHYIARFRNEARMVGRCVHPNIVGIHDFTADDEHLFLVLEYVDGRHLGRRRAAESTAVDLALVGHWILQVLEALGYAHAFGIVHRDVKPSNILVTSSNVVKVTDFGIARALAADATLSSVLVGTPCYMSPEQCLGRAVDGRSDLFSLGCVFYEVLSGARAFSGANYVETTHRILREEPTQIRTLLPDLPAAFATIVETALAKQPDQRYPDAAAMASALRAALRQLDDPAPVTSEPDAPTIVATERGPQVHRRPSADIASLNSRSITTIERRLAAYLGPMARLHVRRAMLQADTPAALCRTLGELLPVGSERELMLADLLRIIAAGTPPAPSTGSLGGQTTSLSDLVVQAHARALADIVGPIAPILVRRALAHAASPEALTAACIERIDDPAEVVRFSSLLACYRNPAL